MSQPRFKYNENEYKKGITLTLDISFIRCKDNPQEMQVLTCDIQRGVAPSCDYSLTLDKTTLLDIIKEFIREE